MSYRYDRRNDVEYNVGNALGEAVCCPAVMLHNSRYLEAMRFANIRLLWLQLPFRSLVLPICLFSTIGSEQRLFRLSRQNAGRRASQSVAGRGRHEADGAGPRDDPPEL